MTEEETAVAEMAQRVVAGRRYRAWEAEGARMGALGCALCGAALLVQHDVDHVKVHAEWHLLMARSGDVPAMISDVPQPISVYADPEEPYVLGPKRGNL